MKTRYLCSPDPQARKNRRRISFITNDLPSTLSLPTPQNGLLAGRCS